MSDDVETEKPGKGKGGPPNDFPGKGRGRDKVPGNAPFEEVKEKLSSIIEESKSEGRLGMRVVDDDGVEKDRLEHVRVSGHGSVEVRPFEEVKTSDAGAEDKRKFKWGMKRRDKLNDNKGGEK